MGRDPAWGSLLSNHLRNLKNGLFCQEWMRAVVQKSSGDLDIYDAFVFVKIEELMMTGQLAMSGTVVRSGPYPDRCDKENNAILDDVSPPFSANFEGGQKHAADGFLSWDEPADFMWNPSGRVDGDETITMPPDTVTLEVGTTASSKTLTHLLYENSEDACGLARWPYGSTVITILKRIPASLQIKNRGRAEMNMTLRMATRTDERIEAELKEGW